MLRVWVDDTPVGRIERHGARGMTFAYDADVPARLAVSLSMPPRVASFDSNFGLLPVFDANLPEGSLRERIQGLLSKRAGKVDALAILAVTGANQIGRIRILPPGQEPERRPPIGSIETLLGENVTSDFVESIMDRFALRSGVAGMMPKVLVEDLAADGAPSDGPDVVDAFEGTPAEGKFSLTGHRITAQTRDWILKFGDGDYPGLPIVEKICMDVARSAGLSVAETHLSRDGHMLAVKRFDERDGRRIAFEDFACLNAKTSEEKYTGSIETGLFRRAADFSDLESRQENLEALYSLVALNIMLRNGDAHLKNFGLVYDDPEGRIEMSPAFDIVSTQVWLQDDQMALTLSGSRKWPDRKALLDLAPRAKISRARAEGILEHMAAAIIAAAPEAHAQLVAAGHSAEADALVACWSSGLVGAGFPPLPDPATSTLDIAPADEDHGAAAPKDTDEDCRP